MTESCGAFDICLEYIAFLHGGAWTKLFFAVFLHHILQQKGFQYGDFYLCYAFVLLYSSFR